MTFFFFQPQGASPPQIYAIRTEAQKWWKIVGVFLSCGLPPLSSSCVLLNSVKNCPSREIPLHFNTNCVVFHIINCMFKKKFKLLDACDFNVIIFCKDYLLFIPSICIILYWINCFISHVCTCQFFSIYSAKFNISEGILKYMKYRLIFFLVFELHNRVSK